MQNWKDLYKELTTVLKDNLETVEWIDLWHNQINHLEEEHAFPSPALFLQFRSLNINDIAENVQNVTLQVDVFVFYETFADTYHDSWNQDSALEFLNLMNDVHSTLHGTSGDNYSNMRRIAFNPVDTGNAGNLYQISFECILTDYAALKAWKQEENELEVNTERFVI